MPQDTSDKGSNAFPRAIKRGVAQLSQAMLLTPNQIRKGMGLPPIPMMRQIYFIEGETDLAAQIKAAERNGRPYRLHHHKADGSILCNENCVTMRKEDDEPTEGTGVDADRG